jgi:hypothetical protein
MTQTIRLTEKEAEVIRHRATQPDCIAEVFSETLDGWTTERVETLLAQIIADTPGKGLRITFNPGTVDHVLLLTELLEGNTTGDAADDYLAYYDIDEPEYRIGVALRRACDSVVRKFHAAGIVASIR